MSVIACFVRDQRGAMSVDFAVWMPLFAVLLVIVSDASMIYQTHAEMWNIARDTARRMSTGSIRSEADAEAYAARELDRYGYAFEVDASYDPASMMGVSILVGVGEVATFGAMIRPWLDKPMYARVAMRSDVSGSGATGKGNGGGNGNGGNGGGNGGNGGGGGSGGSAGGGNGGGNAGGNGGGNAGGNAGGNGGSNGDNGGGNGHGKP